MFHFHWHYSNKKLSGFCFSFAPTKRTLSVKFREEVKRCFKPEIFSWS